MQCHKVQLAFNIWFALPCHLCVRTISIMLTAHQMATSTSLSKLCISHLENMSIWLLCRKSFWHLFHISFHCKEYWCLMFIALASLCLSCFDFLYIFFYFCKCPTVNLLYSLYHWLINLFNVFFLEVNVLRVFHNSLKC